MLLSDDEVRALYDDFQPGKCQTGGLNKHHTWPVPVPLLRVCQDEKIGSQKI